MRTIDCITQEGVVEDITNGLLKVSILSKSLCATCHSKGSCTSFDVAQKEYHFNEFDPNLKPGDKVLLKLHKSLGPMAVFLGYLLPFIIFITILIILSTVFNNDLYAGIGSIISIIIYYLILKLFTKQLQSTFMLKVESIE
jgi:sigma-E factor negative regulatory protein RseC